MACHTVSAGLLVLVVWAIGFGIIAAYVAALTALDNRAERRKSADAPGEDGHPKPSVAPK